MTSLPMPFPVQPGDKLRVTEDNPYRTDLKTNDLVTAMDVGVKVIDGLPVPVVQVSTAYGVQLLTFAVVEPYNNADVLSYAPGESDEIVDAFFSRIMTNLLTEDDALRGFVIEAKEKLAANDPGQKTSEPNGGGTAVKEHPTATQVGEPFLYADPVDGDGLEVTYAEQACPTHGREAAFLIEINDNESVLIRSNDAEHLIRYMIQKLNYFRRPADES